MTSPPDSSDVLEESSFEEGCVEDYVEDEEDY